MTAAFEAKIRAKARAAVDKYGKTVVWRAWTRDGNQYVHGAQIQPGSFVDYPGIKVTPPTTFDPASLRTQAQYAPSDTATKGEMYVSLVNSGTGDSASTRVQLPFVPKVGDEVQIDGAWWAVSGVGNVWSGEDTIMFNARILRGK